MAIKQGSATYAGINSKRTNMLALIGKIVIYTVLSLWALTTIFPFVWVVLNSFKDSNSVINDSFGIPATGLILDNYAKAFTNPVINVPMGYLNSILISVTVTFFVVFFSSMTSFAMTRYEFKGRTVIYLIFIGSLMFPAFATIIPVYRLTNAMQLFDTHLGIMLPQIAGNLCFAITVLMGFMISLPKELEEAAFLEGCNVWQIYYKIIVPLSTPAFATVAIFTFLWSYNDLFTQIILIKNKKNLPTITVLLQLISSQFGTDYGLMAASVTLVAVPVLIVYLFLQKSIIKGLTAGAVKG